MIEAIRTEYAEDKGHAEQHDIGKRRRHAANDTGTRIPAEDTGGDQMAGSPGDRDGREVSAP